MNFEISEHDGITVIALIGKIMGGPEAAQINEKINSLIDEGKKNIIIDLEKVEWMNSSGLGILIGAIQTLKNNDGTLCLIHVSDRISELLRITKLINVFKIMPDLPSAVNAIQTGS
jgi:anti-sigma B factor antagonist